MAVFLINICKFNGCGITFPSLSDLISHIEDTHIDYDPKVVEQKEQAQPACLPLSYVLRFISDDARKEAPYLATNAAGVELKRKLAIKHHSYSMSSSNRSNTPTGSEMDEDEMVVTESEDSNDSWTTEEFSSEFIMRYGSRHSGGGANGTPGNEKPFACPVPGCKKRYKNVNGIKYHSKNGHKKDGKVRKGFKCHCGKSYKTAQGLKNHALLTHNSQPDSVLTTQHVAAAAASGGNGSGVLLHRSGSPSQSLGSLSPSSMSNMSSSASSCHGGSNGGGSIIINPNNNNSSNTVSSNGSGVLNGNMLQQLSNGIVTVQQQQTTTQQLSATQQHQQQQQQQHIQIATTPTTTETSYSCSQISNNNNRPTMPTTPPTTSTVVPANLSQNLINNTTATTTTVSATVNHNNTTTTLNARTQQQQTTMPMHMSPTFIEHQYYASNEKEQRFFSNLRNSNGNSNVNAPNAAYSKITANSVINNKSSNKNNNDGVTSSSSIGVGGVVVGGGGSGVGSSAGAAVGQLCALQTENFHQNLYKKTIN